MHSAASTLRLPPLPSIGELLQLYRIKASKRLSQNFLFDSKLRSKVVSCGGRNKNFHIIEVGPGPGGLTRSIFEQGAKYVDVIEKDRRFLASLELLRDATQNRLGIHLGDILNFDLSNLIPKDSSQPWDGPVPDIKIIGNLPFSVSTPLIIRWLHQISLRSNAWAHGRVPMTLTFQEEVGQRMIALRRYQRSRLSIMCQNWCDVDYKFTIPGKAFIPKPDVNVAVVHFVPKIQPEIAVDFKIVEKVVRCLFSQRQKHCKRGLGMLFPEPVRDDLVAKLLAVADINPCIRPFNLSMMEVSRVVHAYVAITEETPSLFRYSSRRVVQEVPLVDLN